MSLAELAVESATITDELSLSMTSIAEKFAEFYWPQTVPYASGATGATPSILSQNLGEQASVIKSLLALRSQGGATLAQAKRLPSWPNVIRKIALTVSGMPVQHLQNIGGTLVPFLYDYPHAKAGIILKPGVVFMLRTFHPLIQQLAQAGWVRHVRENRRNASIIGQADELEIFMFGSSRNALIEASKVLAKIQSRKCFYCGGTISDSGHVDHFIPWSKYPRDLGHNFVLAHAGCNRNKSNMLAAQRHLAHWVERNMQFGQDISGELSQFLADRDCSIRVTRWAYEQGLVAGAHGWIEGKATEPLGEDCLVTLVI